MTGQLRAELLKQRSTQTTFFLLLAMIGLVALASALHVLAPAASDLASLKHQLAVFEVGTRVGMLFAALVGAMAITAEIRYGTIRPTFLVIPATGRCSPPSSPSARSQASLRPRRRRPDGRRNNHRALRPRHRQPAHQAATTFSCSEAAPRRRRSGR